MYLYVQRKISPLKSKYTNNFILNAIKNIKFFSPVTMCTIPNNMQNKKRTKQNKSQSHHKDKKKLF